MIISDSLNDEMDIDLDSEEEKDIVKQIKEEITNQVSTAWMKLCTSMHQFLVAPPQAGRLIFSLNDLP